MKQDKVPLSQDAFRDPDTDKPDHKDVNLLLQQDQDLQDEDDREKDPMKISLVLQRIFDFCSVDDLKSRRLVCTQWHNDSMKVWRDNAVLRISFSPDCKYTSKHDDAFNLTEYLQLMASNGDGDGDDDYGDYPTLKYLQSYPFQRFCLVPNDYRDELDQFPNETVVQPMADIARYLRIDCNGDRATPVSVLREFLLKFHSLEVLRLKILFNEEDQEQNNEEDPVDFKLEKIRRLEIDQDEYTFQEVWGWGHVLKWLPRLEALSIEYKDMSRSACLDNLTSIVTFVKTVRESGGGGSVMSLKELEIHTPPETDGSTLRASKHINRVIEWSNFPLKRLVINSGYWSIYDLLYSCKDTLEFLKINFHFDAEDFEDFKMYFEHHFVAGSRGGKFCMGRLKEANLGNGHHRALCLLSHFKLPNLKKLTIERDECKTEAIVGKFPVSFPKGRVFNKLKVLNFFDIYTTPSPITIEAFSGMMPNLGHLTIPLDKKSFQSVCARFRGLKTLNVLSAELFYEELDDECLTGVSVSNSKNIGGEGEPRPPNITHLALLTDLKICCEPQLRRNDVKFTDHAVLHGFLKLPHLYSLSIAFKNLSEHVRAKLMNHVKGNVCIQEKPPVDDVCIAMINGDCLTDSDEEE